MKTTSKKITKIKTTSTKKIKNEDDLKKKLKKMKTTSKKMGENEDDLKKKYKKIGCDIIVN